MEKVLAGLPSLSIYPVALGSEDAQLQFHVAASPDCSSVLAQTLLQAQSFPGTHNTGRQEVPVRRLDKLLDGSRLLAPVICKIDVQGYELQVLRGFGKLLDSIDYLIVELTNVSFYEGAPNSAEVIAFLAERQFKIVGIYDMYIRNKMCLQADFFLRRDANWSRPTE